MNSAKLIAEASFSGRRASLNQLDILNQLIKVSTPKPCRKDHSSKPFIDKSSDVFQFSPILPESHSKNRFHEGGLFAGSPSHANVKNHSRRASCCPTLLLQSHEKLTGFSILRKSSQLSSVDSGESIFGENLYLSSVSSNFGNVLNDGCRLFDFQQEFEEGKTNVSVTNDVKNSAGCLGGRKFSVPLIKVHEASKELDASNYEGFSLWIIEHLRHGSTSSRSFEKRPREKNRQKTNTLGQTKTKLSNTFTTLGNFSRRTSLSTKALNVNFGKTLQTRKSSLHSQSLNAPVSKYSPCLIENGYKSADAMGSCIGKGGFGSVHVGKYKGDLVAIKKIYGISNTNCSSSGEITSLKIPPHPNLVKSLAVVTPCENTGLYRVYKRGQGNFKVLDLSWNSTNLSFGAKIETISENASNKDDGDNQANMKWEPIGFDLKWIWVVSELCTSSTLLSVIESPAQLNVKDKIRLLGELSSGVSFLHSKGFIHRDIKPANVLLSTFGSVKLGDFGCCRHVNDSTAEKVIGTLSYQAPEVMKGDLGDESSDVFSFGITGWHLLTRNTPYRDVHPHVIAYNVTRIGLRPDWTWPVQKTVEADESSSSGNLLELLLKMIFRKCWRSEPTSRPTSESLCKSLALLYVMPGEE